jgi:DNA-binding CsgD family transcriptional regulator
VEVVARYHAVRFGAGPADADRLRTLAAGLGTPFAAALAALPDTEAAATLEALGHPLLAGEAYAAVARAHRADGRRASANVYAEKAAALRDGCGAPTPSSGVTELLTPGEREVVLLAVGHSSAEIAARLGLSVRTVDNNLNRAYAKLGVSGRARLRALLGGA